MKEIVMSEAEIREVTKKFGRQFTELFKDDPLPPVFIGVMKGSLPFMMDLIREIQCPVLIDFVQISSYLGTESTGVIKLKKDISLDITNRKVVIIEDIIDSGCTLRWFKDYLEKTYNPKQVLTCVLLDKKCKRKVEYDVEYVGKVIGDQFIVGYGLDYDEYYRNEREIFIPSQEEIEAIDKANGF